MAKVTTEIKRLNSRQKANKAQLEAKKNLEQFIDSPHRKHF